MNIYDTTNEMLLSFEDNQFDLPKWERYMDSSVSGAKEICLNDMQECIQAGFSWENDYLPVLNSVIEKSDVRDEAISTFHIVADDLEEKIWTRFGRSVDTDIVLYLGLCNGAGWVTVINGKSTVLLGIEKIIELNWHDIDSMNALIVHELCHVYHAQYGRYCKNEDIEQNQFLWQLFKEGVAMVFEQDVLDDPKYFHQDKNGWQKWCDDNSAYIKESFSKVMKTMTRDDQRYFGDWVDFEGHSDVGYYLGTKFVRFLLQSDSFDNVIQYDIEKISESFELFLDE